MEYDLQLIGARLQAARKAKGYTQDYVSARADITEKFLSQIERGKAGLSVQTLIALCDILMSTEQKKGHVISRNSAVSAV